MSTQKREFAFNCYLKLIQNPDVLIRLMSAHLYKCDFLVYHCECDSMGGHHGQSKYDH